MGVSECPTTDPCGDVGDSDGDGMCDDTDNCPEVSNPEQQDEDTDGLGDACDVCPEDAMNDADGDGICADADNCPDVINEDQMDGDEDGIGDACDACPTDDDNDQDGDGYCEDEDNCHEIFNPDQEDFDGDGLGDICDACVEDPDNDMDGDGTCGNIDPCPADPDDLCATGDATFETYGYNGYSGDLLYGFGTGTAEQVADNFCSLVGYGYASDYTPGLTSPLPFTCWCVWDDLSVNSPCCSASGPDVTQEITVLVGTVTCAN